MYSMVCEAKTEAGVAILPRYLLWDDCRCKTYMANLKNNKGAADRIKVRKLELERARARDVGLESSDSEEEEEASDSEEEDEASDSDEGASGSEVDVDMEDAY